LQKRVISYKLTNDPDLRLKLFLILAIDLIDGALVSYIVIKGALMKNILNHIPLSLWTKHTVELE